MGAAGRGAPRRPCRPPRRPRPARRPRGGGARSPGRGGSAWRRQMGAPGRGRYGAAVRGPRLRGEGRWDPGAGRQLWKPHSVSTPGAQGARLSPGRSLARVRCVCESLLVGLVGGSGQQRLNLCPAGGTLPWKRPPESPSRCEAITGFFSLKKSQRAAEAPALRPKPSHTSRGTGGSGPPSASSVSRALGHGWQRKGSLTAVLGNVSGLCLTKALLRSNLGTIITCFKCTIQRYLVYLGFSHHNLILEHFHHPKRNPCAH